jgi:hypothetical protein
VTPFPLIYIYIPRAVVELELNPPLSVLISIADVASLFYANCHEEKHVLFFPTGFVTFLREMEVDKQVFLKKQKKIDRDGLIMIKDGINSTLDLQPCVIRRKILNKQLIKS